MWESNIEQLRKQLLEIRFKDGKSVDDFSMRIMVTGRLRNDEQWNKNVTLAIDKQGRLLLTEEERLARLKL